MGAGDVAAWMSDELIDIDGLPVEIDEECPIGISDQGELVGLDVFEDRKPAQWTDPRLLFQEASDQALSMIVQRHRIVCSDRFNA